MAHSRETGVSWKLELPTAAQPSTRGGAAPGQEGGMSSVLFTNVRIFDGTGALPYPGELPDGARPQPARRVRTGGNPA